MQIPFYAFLCSFTFLILLVPTLCPPYFSPFFSLSPHPKPSTTYNSMHKLSRPLDYSALHLPPNSLSYSAAVTVSLSTPTNSSFCSPRTRRSIMSLSYHQLRLVSNGQIVLVTTDTSANNLHTYIHTYATYATYTTHRYDTSVSSQDSYRPSTK
jgi:hypothetical protein